jgi:cob(I)alamin adenosyltransferase
LEVSHELRAALARVQNELFDLGADLAVPFAEGDERLRIVVQQVAGLEELCDRFNEQIEPLKSFVLPGGTEAGARLHLARTVCRRAELAALAVSPANPAAHVPEQALDLLFILARVAMPVAASRCGSPARHGRRDRPRRRTVPKRPRPARGAGPARAVGAPPRHGE